PVSPELWAVQQTAALTSLAFVMHARPRARLCSGRLLLLGGGTTLTPLGNPEHAGSLEAIAIRELPAFFRPYAFHLPPRGVGAGRRGLRVVPAAGTGRGQHALAGDLHRRHR